ncbi:hypothetical protein KF707_03975 [Candidatus Obscuribacterales bacterium]|nr:hypothetical protein [Candidatus Obscuribacterales bacterium]
MKTQGASRTGRYTSDITRLKETLLRNYWTPSYSGVIAVFHSATTCGESLTDDHGSVLIW